MSFRPFQTGVVLSKEAEITENTIEYKVSLYSGESMVIQMQDGLVAGDEFMMEKTKIFVCSECNNELMHNSKINEYYCPKCDKQ